MDACVIAEREGRALGLLAVNRSAWNRRAIVAHLYVDRAARKGGIGTAFIEEARAIAEAWGARSLWVETQNVNPAGIDFYRRRGFTFCGADISLYDPNLAGDEVAVFFELRLE